jgi:hypothetical protein
MPKKKKKKTQPLKDIARCTEAELNALTDGVPERVAIAKGEVDAKRNEVMLYDTAEEQVPVLWEIIALQEDVVQKVSTAGEILLEQSRRYHLVAVTMEKKADELTATFKSFRKELDKSHSVVEEVLARDDIPDDVKEYIKMAKIALECHKKIAHALRTENKLLKEKFAEGRPSNCD